MHVEQIAEGSGEQDGDGSLVTQGLGLGLFVYAMIHLSSFIICC